MLKFKDDCYKLYNSSILAAVVPSSEQSELSRTCINGDISFQSFRSLGGFRSKENKIYIEVRFKLVSGGLTL